MALISEHMGNITCGDLQVANVLQLCELICRTYGGLRVNNLKVEGIETFLFQVRMRCIFGARKGSSGEAVRKNISYFIPLSFPVPS